MINKQSIEPFEIEWSDSKIIKNEKPSLFKYSYFGFALFRNKTLNVKQGEKE